MRAACRLQITGRMTTRRVPPLATGDDPPGSTGTPYTVIFPTDGGPPPADLQHPAALPRIGETVEYLDHGGRCQRYVVVDVVHTLQVASEHRPVVGAEPSLPAGVAREQRAPDEAPSSHGALRAGLPRVVLAEAEADHLG